MNIMVRILTMLALVIVFSPLTGYADGPYGGGSRHGGGSYYRGGGGYYRGGGGIWITPGWGPWFGGYYPYYYTAPPVIVERPSIEYYYQQVPQQEEEPAYWYYCKKPEGYYPYVQHCPDGWMKVVPKPSTPDKEK
jgi:hypothetical protein